MYNLKPDPPEQDLLEVERKALLALVRDQVTWQAVLKETRILRNSANSVLNYSMDMNEVVHARGRKLGLENLVENINQVAREEEEKENG